MGSFWGLKERTVSIPPHFEKNAIILNVLYPTLLRRPRQGLLSFRRIGLASHLTRIYCVIVWLGYTKISLYNIQCVPKLKIGGCCKGLAAKRPSFPWEKKAVMRMPSFAENSLTEWIIASLQFKEAICNLGAISIWLLWGWPLNACTCLYPSIQPQ